MELIWPIVVLIASITNFAKADEGKASVIVKLL